MDLLWDLSPTFSEAGAWIRSVVLTFRVGCEMWGAREAYIQTPGSILKKILVELEKSRAT